MINPAIHNTFYNNVKLKRMKKILLLFIVGLVSCKRDAQQTEFSGDFKIEFLFEKDGCKIYRFYDGRYVYWANCAGKVSSDYSTSNGKSTTTHRQETVISVSDTDSNKITVIQQ